jgi:hypothetical protein
MANPHTSVKARKHGVPNKMSRARVERVSVLFGVPGMVSGYFCCQWLLAGI